MREQHNTRAQKPILVTPAKPLELPDFREVWHFRDLMLFLTSRNIKVRFQQTFVGVFWIVLQPLIQMVIFTVIFGILIRVPTDDIPYPVFFLTGFIVWQLFSQIVNSSAYSMVEHIGVITKSYFPRLILPFSSTISSIIDFVVFFVLLLIFLIASGFYPSFRYLLLPVLVIITIFFSSGVGLLFGAWMVVFRDVKNLLQFILMIWMYITPILYPITIVPEEYRILFRLNPLSILVESFRWVFLGVGTLPPNSHFFISFLIAMVIWFMGAIAFRNMENKIADVL